MNKLQEFINKLKNGDLKFNFELINKPNRMKELGFFDAEEYWLYNKYFTCGYEIGIELSFDFEIFKKDTLKNSIIRILDEECLQPYEYWRYWKETDKIYQEIEEQIQKNIEYLIQCGVLIEVKPFIGSSIVKLQTKFEYQAAVFKYTDSERSMENIKKIFEVNGVDILKVETDPDYKYPDPNWCMYLFVRTKSWELDTVTVKDGWYVWVDEIGLVNSADPNYIRDNYEVK